MVSPASDPASPTAHQVNGRYSVSAALGQGPISSVYRAVDSLTGGPVVLKVFAPLAPIAAPDEFRRRVLNAARLMRPLSHPNIVAIHDFGECADGTPYVAMEALGGLTLRDSIDSGIVLPPYKILDLALRILDGLDYAHRHGVVHGDLTPGNVMLAHHGTVKILDFGIALPLDDAETPVGPSGSPLYLAPEQLQAGAADARSDVFALGVILYELLTGVRPFAADSLAGVRHNIMHLDPAPPGQLNAEVPPGLDHAVMRALAKNPAARFASARAMHDALTAVCLQSLDVWQSAGAATPLMPNEAAAWIPARSAFRPEALPVDAEWRPTRGFGRRKALLAGAAIVGLGALVAIAVRETAPVAQPVTPASPAIPHSSAMAEVARPAAEPAAEEATESVTEPVADESGAGPAPATSSASSASADTSATDHRARASSVRKHEDAREGRLQLSVLPWGEIHVNGRRLAVTPPQRSLGLPPGVYRIEIRNGTFPPRVQKIRIESGKSVSIRHRFQ